MGAKTSNAVHTGSNADLAIVLMVLAAYFAIFSSLHTATGLQIFLMVVLGTAYILMGVYVYAWCMRRNLLVFNLGYFGLQIITGGWIVYLGRGAGFSALILLPLASQSVMLLMANWVYAVNLAIACAYLLAVRLTSGSWNVLNTDLPTFLAGLVFVMVFTQMAVNEEQARGRAQQMANNLEEANQRLRQYAMQVEELATAKERNRLAREIHDGLGHYLTIVHVQLQAAQAVLEKDPQRARELLGTAQTLTSEALLDVRQSVAALRSSPDEQLPLPGAIEKMLQSCQSAGIQAQLSVLGEPRLLAPQVHLSMYRAVQEGLNNICKHSHATKAWVTLDYHQPGWVRLVVQDNGMGAELGKEEGFGLLGMRERVQMLNGKFEAKSIVGQGFTLEMVVPG